jgi:hypothetical protein
MTKSKSIRSILRLTKVNSHSRGSFAWTAIFALVTIAPFPASAQFNTELSPKATAAFNDYQKKAESQMKWQPRYPQLQPGDVKVDPIRNEGSIDVTDGMVHDWVAATVVPGIGVDQVLKLLQNYAAYKTIYTPDVIDSKALTHNGNQWHMYLQMVKKKVFTVVLNGEFDVDYRDLGSGRWAVTSRSTRLAQVDGDHEMPVGTGLGFVWRLNAYWLIEPRANGVYLECRSLSLSRDIPFGLGFAVKPFVTGVPPESLRQTLTATAQALKK